jgi:type II secretory pathway predicted ATPase ExeA
MERGVAIRGPARRIRAVWLSYWNLARDPFLGPDRVFVPTGSHAEALARLMASVESGERLAVLRGAEGVGKSVTLARLAAELRGPRRRVSLVSCPGDGLALLAGLAAGLGRHVPAGATRSIAWSTLADAVRVCQWQKLHPVLVVDDIRDLPDDRDRHDLTRLTQLGERTSPFTVVQARGETDGADAALPQRWLLSVRLLPLTRSETECYVAAKLAAARRVEPVFAPAALSRVHHLSGGVPRGIDRIASLALMAGALQRVPRVTHRIVDDVACECLSPAA